MRGVTSLSYLGGRGGVVDYQICDQVKIQLRGL